MNILCKALATLGAAGCSVPQSGLPKTEDEYLTSVRVITPEGLVPPPYPWAQVLAEMTKIETEIAFEALRAERDARLAKSDFVMFPDVQVPNKDAWLSYRQALRDLPSTAHPALVAGVLDPESVCWPPLPTEPP
jgi:hypothetical protein